MKVHVLVELSTGHVLGVYVDEPAAQRAQQHYAATGVEEMFIEEHEVRGTVETVDEYPESLWDSAGDEWTLTGLDRYTLVRPHIPGGLSHVFRNYSRADIIDLAGPITTTPPNWG